MHPYPVEIFWSEEDEGFIAVLPDLPGCSAWGEFEEEALRASHQAAAWIEAARAAGNPVPEPSRPADDRICPTCSPSGARTASAGALIRQGTGWTS